MASAAQASATIFLLIRRMRAPLVVLITVLSVSVLGLLLIPGQGPDGQPVRMGMLHAFYVVSYTATTIGFGEIPHEFTDAQRVWVTISIYLVVDRRESRASEVAERKRCSGTDRHQPLRRLR